ncbi:MAG: hypothetical protein QNL04_13540 [SAR324 cluster bacterium]|nr:hypothetical protein [SAR324 cluster bacterium]
MSQDIQISVLHQCLYHFRGKLLSLKKPRLDEVELAELLLKYYLINFKNMPTETLDLFPYFASLASGLFWGWVFFLIGKKRGLKHCQFWIALGVFLGPIPLPFIFLARVKALDLPTEALALPAEEEEKI